MKLIVGLGNPGSKYHNNRHNIGFLVVDKLSEKMKISFKKEIKFNGEVAEHRVGGEKIVLLKPLTYMNLSGNSIRAIIDYYKIDIKDIIIVYDDLDLETGRFRIRTQGSAGGQKGMTSIIEKLGTKDINRLRMGISKPVYQSVPDYVLSDFPKEEIPLINETIDEAVEALELFIKESNIDLVMNRYNKKV